MSAYPGNSAVPGIARPGAIWPGGPVKEAPAPIPIKNLAGSAVPALVSSVM